MTVDAFSSRKDFLHCSFYPENDALEWMSPDERIDFLGERIERIDSMLRRADFEALSKEIVPLDGLVLPFCAPGSEINFARACFAEQVSKMSERDGGVELAPEDLVQLGKMYLDIAEELEKDGERERAKAPLTLVFCIGMYFLEPLRRGFIIEEETGDIRANSETEKNRESGSPEFVLLEKPEKESSDKPDGDTSSVSDGNNNMKKLDGLERAAMHLIRSIRVLNGMLDEGEYLKAAEMVIFDGCIEARPEEDGTVAPEIAEDLLKIMAAARIVLASMFETCAAAGERMYAWQIPAVRHTMRISAKYLEKGVFSEAAGPGSFIARMAANAIRSFFLIDPREDEQP